MKKNIFILLGLVYSLCLPLSAQRLINEQLPQKYYVRVNLFDDFINRFNFNEEAIAKLNINFDLQKGIWGNRSYVILSLFDHPAPDLNNQCVEFANYITSNNLIIDRYSNDWNSVVELVYKNQKNQSFSFFFDMILEEGDRTYHWIINGVESSYFTYGDEEKIGYIGYVDNELGFMEMYHVQGANPEHLAGRSFKPDNVSTFLFLTANGFLNYEHSKSQYYKVRQGEYDIIISLCDPEDHERSGLLITEMKKNGEIVFSNER